MSDSPWLQYLSKEKRKELDRDVARQLLEILLPKHEQWYEELVRKEIIPTEMVDALYDLSRDPLDRNAILDRISNMVSKYLAIEKEKRTLTGMVQKLQSDNELIKMQMTSIETQLANALTIAPTELILPSARRGPRDYGKDEQRKIVERYLEKQDSIRQFDYAVQWNISERTLRRWVDSYKKGEI